METKQFLEQIFDECNFEIIEKNDRRIDLILKLNDFYNIDLSEFEPDFSEALYAKSLEFCNIENGDFFWEGNQLNKSIEITINF